MASAYTIQRNNSTRTILLITIFVLVTVGFFYALGFYFQNPIFSFIGLALGIGQPLIGYFFGDKIALSFARAKQVEYDESPQLHEMIENLSRIAGIPKPKVYISPDPSPNAFATGRNPKTASVCFNQGILDILNKNELEGVAAHELAHIKNRDTLIMTIAAILASVVGILADFAGRAALFGFGGNNENRNPLFTILYFVIILIIPVVTFLLQMAVSRSREFVADATAVTFTRYPDGLKNALLKLHNNPVPATTAHSFTNHLYIAEPKQNFGQKIGGLFSTHPPVEQRVANLESMGSL